MNIIGVKDMKVFKDFEKSLFKVFLRFNLKILKRFCTLLSFNI